MRSRGGRPASVSGGLGPRELGGWRRGEPATLACGGRWVAAAGILRFSNPLSKRHQDSVEEIGRQRNRLRLQYLSERRQDSRCSVLVRKFVGRTESAWVSDFHDVFDRSQSCQF